MAVLHTTLGPKTADQLGMILPHEHVFVDLRTWDTPGYGEADVADVVALMAPEIEKIKALGVTALVECSTGGVALRPEMDRAVSEATNFPIVCPTGVYREPWVPEWAHHASEDELYEWMASELHGEIKDTGVKAAWIKVSAGDDGITESETKILRAAARAAKEVNAIIGSHTIRQRVVKDQLRIIEDVGYTPERFIWIHTQAEEDYDLHLEMAERGVWIEYDWIGGDRRSDEYYIEGIKRLLNGGYGTKLLLSHDRGWYDPGNPDRVPRPYTYISETFLPRLRDAGVDEATIIQLTHTNPFNAYAR
jgi:phosphotriesterase-related protein